MKFRAALIAISLLFVFSCGKTPAGKSAPADAAPAVRSDGILPTDKVLGDRNAPVTLIEYASITCPACAAVAEQILPDIKEKFVDTGQVKLVFREYPTHNPELSLAVSVLARCASENVDDAAYFTLLDGLFKTQGEWAENVAPRSALERIFDQAGLEGSAFETCLNRNDLVDIVNENAKSGIEEFNVRSTPTFVLNGSVLALASKEDFEKSIAAAVKEAGAE